MTKAKLLSSIAIGLTLLGVGLITLLDSNLTIAHYVSRLNEVDAEYQALSSGLFLLIGIFWMGAIDTVRRSIEPKKMDPWLRFSVIAFAASYLLSMVFPCDAGCPPTGSLNQLLHNTLVWLLYAGPFVFAIRVFFLPGMTLTERGICTPLLGVFVVMQLDVLFWQNGPGVLQRVYEFLFCWLWWQTLPRLSHSS